LSTTLLTAVNDILKRASIIAGDSSALTSLTDAARQVDIDISVQVINEANIALYADAKRTPPSGQSSSTITLVTNTRNYTLASDIVRLHNTDGILAVDKTNTQFIYEYDGGYDRLLQDIDPEVDDTGTPLYGVIRPTDGALYVYPTPDSTVNGNVYTYQYDKSLIMSTYTDTFPFSDDCYSMMRPCYFQLWKRQRRNEFDGDLFKAAIGTAAKLLPQLPQRTDYFPR
jgi:hypothetical protein